MADKLIVSASPHYRSNRTIRSVMFDVILALTPLLIMGTIMYGWRALAMTVVSAGSCVAFESAFNLLRKKKNSVWDLSAVVTGMLLAFMLPVTTSYIYVIAGSFFAIVVVKMLFGGIGKNFLNPALAARAFIGVFASFTYVIPFATDKVSIFYDSIFNRTDISAIEGTAMIQTVKDGTFSGNSIFSMLIGDNAGNMGETCVLLIVICGVYLLAKGVITWHIPVTYLGTVALITYLLPADGGTLNVDFMLSQLCSGCLVLAAFFMATDYSTCPVTNNGRIIHGIGCGILTVILRYFGATADGVIFALLIMNIFAESLDVVTRPSRYGKGGMRHEEKT